MTLSHPSSQVSSSGILRACCRRFSSSFLFLALTFVVCCVYASTPVAAQRSPNGDMYQVYRTHTLCPDNIARDVQCPVRAPMCCMKAFAIRCCPDGMPCSQCDADVRGYDMSRANVMLSVMSLAVLLLLGSVIAAGVGKHCAWYYERSSIVAAYKARAALRREEARQYREQLVATEMENLDEEEACTICCARRIDCALVPCGHACNCRFCAARLRECPVCRKEVDQYYDLPDYLVQTLVRGGARVSAAVTDDGAQHGEDTTADVDERGAEEDERRREVREGARSAEVGIIQLNCTEGEACVSVVTSPRPGVSVREGGVEGEKAVEGKVERRLGLMYSKRYTRVAASDDDTH